MKFKSKFLFLLLVFSMLLSVSAVSADEMTTQSIIEESSEHSSVSTEIATDELLSASNDVENLANPDDGTFKALQNKINGTSPGDKIKLENNYENKDKFNQTGIIISHPLTIDGNGYTIDAMGNGRIFHITSAHVILKNINFKNANYIEDFGQGGAIFWNGNFGILENCSFENCSAIEGGAIHYGGNEKGTILGCNFTDCSSQWGGAICWVGNSDCSVVDCNFVNCSVTGNGNGGAIYFMADTGGSVVGCNFTDCHSEEEGGAIFLWENIGDYISDCNFMNCVADSNNPGGYGGGAICWTGNEEGYISNSTFVNCSATGDYGYGGAIKWESDDGTVDNCNFVDCSATYNGGAISWSYSNNGSVLDCNFTDCSSGFNGGAISWVYSDNGKIHDCSFINCSTTFDTYGSSSGGAISLLWSHNTIIDYSNFENCSSVGFGGAIDSYSDTSNNTVNYCIFTGNSAINGSAIYHSNQHGTFTIKNSILLNNRANSDQLNLTEKNNNITIVFTGKDNLLNAIYTEDNIDFDNVSYWGVNGIMNTDSRPLSKSNREEGQYIFITINNNGLIKQYMDVTDEKGEISFNVNVAGDYRINAYHPEDSYYTECYAAPLNFFFGNPSDLNLTVSNVTATATVTSGATGNVTFTINNESGIVKEQTVNLTQGIANLDLSDLNAGKYNITAVYNGDSNYWPSINKTSFEIYKIDNYDIIVDAKSGTVEEITNITVTVPSKITGTVTVNINDTVYPTRKVNDTTYIAHVSGLIAGNYVVNASVSEDPKYADKTSDVERFDVVKVSAYNIGVVVDPNPAEVDSVVSVIVTVPGDVTGLVSVNINGSVYSTRKVNDTTYIADISGLAAGYYLVNASVSNDPKYADKTSDVERFDVVKVSAYNIGVVVDPNPAEVDSVVSVIVTVPGDVTGPVSVNINGSVYPTRKVNDTIYVAQVSGLVAGNYVVNASVSEDPKYADKTSDVERFDVVKVSAYNIGVVVDPNPAEVDSVVSVIVTVPGDVTGPVSVNINGSVYPTRKVNDTTYVAQVSGLVAGNYVVNASVSEDPKYADKTSDVERFDVVKVSAYNIGVVVDPNPAEVDSVVSVIVTVPGDVTGPVSVNINGSVYPTRKVNDTTYVAQVSGLVAGNYVVNASVSEDPKYADKTSDVEEFEVVKDENYIIDVVVDPNPAEVDSVVSVIVTVPGDVTGVVSVNINGSVYSTSKVNDTTYVADVPGLTVGNYVVNASVTNDPKYADKTSDVEEFEVIKDENYTIDVVVDDDNLVITVPDDFSGIVTVDVNGTVYPARKVNNTTYIVDVSDLTPGNYTVNVNVSADPKYAEKSFNYTIFVNDVVIESNDVVKFYHGPEKLVVSIVDYNGKGIANKTVLIKINGITYNKTTDDSGVAYISINLNSGNYSARVQVSEYDFDKNVSVEVKPTIYASDVSKVFRNDTQYWALFVDSNGKALANTNVTFNINGVFYNRTTNASGWAKLNINLIKGEYILTALNPVTGEMKSNKIVVLSNLETSDLTKYYKNNSHFIVRIVNPDGSYAGAGEKVDFNIHGRIYSRTTNATGHAVLNINLGPGDYIITTYYKDCREGNTIKVLPVLSASDLTMNYGEESYFTANLVDGEGKSYPNQKVVFNINGVSYQKTTDVNGNAKLKINLMPGQYTITSIYDDSSISNTIKIK